MKNVFIVMLFIEYYRAYWKQAWAKQCEKVQRDHMKRAESDERLKVSLRES